jgi:hypothetical protein
MTFLSDSFLVVGIFLVISFDTALLVSLPNFDVLGVLGSPLAASLLSSPPFLVATIFLMPGVINPLTLPVSLLPVVALPVTY